MKVIKKDGTVEDWNFDKIRKAVTKSSARLDKEFTKFEELEALISLNLRYNNEVNVSELHDVVIKSLKILDPSVSKSYAEYRDFYINKTVRNLDEIFEQSKETLYLGDRENANYDSSLNSTKGSLIRGYLTKELYKQYFLSDKELEAISDGYIYIHDLKDLIFNSFNCCLFDLETVFNGGFEMSGVKYREPKTFLSAAQVAGDVTLVATAQQFGGWTLGDFDKVMVKYAMKSYDKHLADFKKYFNDDVNAEHYATEKLIEEIRQGIQSFEMKLNTVPSSRGDTAFVTITFGNVDGKDERFNYFQRLICEHILETRMNGQGDGTPVVFPKLVFLYSKEQISNPNQEKLFKKAVRCSSKTMYPDWLSLDSGITGNIYNETGKVIHPMGELLPM